ncbi:GNAT family N-acetyltransferase [Micromonospora sp. WMMD1082]|nr:GNAT family N-acetyltransferase [Micromonospora sp. WMMD1082]MDG4797975.1 GNAT family N-acetyltransferase [Micromonospora sp. WMMD1082]
MLDNPVWAALTGPHTHLAEVNGEAARYQPDVAPFTTLAADHHARAWDDLAALVGPGTVVAVAGTNSNPPAGWDVVERITGVQMVATALRVATDPEAVRLRPSDVPEMLDLVARTEPGPFRQRTIELGTYLGIRIGGKLVAMAGERLHPPGWTEISAVCTDPAYRRLGLGSRLVRAVAAGIRERGETPFLHAAADNTRAIRLYRSLGFSLRRHTMFNAYRTPDLAPVLADSAAGS